MSLDEFLKKSSQEINKELENFFPKKTSKQWIADVLGKPDYDFDEIAVQKALTDPVWDFLDRGGKRWRPILMLLACEAVGGNKKEALSFTVIPELVHNGTIMVDDVEDNSPLRRGKKSTHLLFGVDVAVNAANSMYYLPLATLFNNTNISSEKKSRIYDLYSKEMLRLSFGQATDIYWHNNQGKVSEPQYLQMCSYKTGSLVRLATQLGAILGNGSEEQVNALGDFGTNIGVSFQIQDDILNLKPDKKWGKEIGEDIKEGKITLIVIRALGVLPKEKQKRLIEILGANKNSSEEVSEAISLLEQSGSIDYAKKVAKDIVSKSWKNLEKKLPESNAKSMLNEFANFVIERNI